MNPGFRPLLMGGEGMMGRTEQYRYRFDDRVSFRDVEDLLSLAALATESIHGRSQVRLDASFVLDADSRCCLVDAGTPVGQDIARIFLGFLSQDLGEEAFRVERVADPVGSETDEASPSVATKGE